jgi:hypothetical protein
MIRPVTSLTLILAASSGLYLYQVKHRTRLLDHRIAVTVAETAALRARSGVLQAEWALLNQPDRLGDLALRYLALRPLQPAQFVAAADLATHLPPVAPAEDPAPAATAPIAARTDAPPVPETVVDPAAAPAPVATPRPALGVLPALGALKAMAVMTPAPAHPPARPPAPTMRRPPAPPALAPQPVALALAHPRGDAATRGARSEPASPRSPTLGVPAATLVSTPSFIGSALGGRHANLPPPVPLAARPDAQ